MLSALLAVTVAASPGQQIAFEKYTLPNGLTVILSEDHRLPHVAVNVWYRVGAANQRPGRSGFAHLFEHMMFAGSKHVGSNTLQLFEQVGARAGSAVNGTTNLDRTNYFELLPSPELPLALWVEADRMGFLTLDAEKLRIQRDVVSNERRQSYENRPYGRATLRLCDLLYPKPHPYFHCVIGELSDIQSASVEEVQDFFREYYPPSNASLVIAGDFDTATAKRLVALYFGALTQKPRPPPPEVRVSARAGPRRERLEDPLVHVSRVTLAWPGVTPYAPDERAGDVAAVILGDGRTSRLYRDLVVQQQVASSVSASNVSARLTGWFSLTATATAQPGADEAALTALLLSHAQKLATAGPTPAELSRAKRQLLAERLRRLQKIGGFGGQADMLNEYEMYTGDAGFFPADLRRIKAVTAEDVKRFLVEHLHDDRRIELWTVPQPAQSPGANPS
ncbi:MAG: M16 family metallopeptidase [Myxococcaceae bacterium]